MAYNYDYGGDVMAMRPGASRRTRGMDMRSREFGGPEPKRSSVDPLRHSHYSNNYKGDSNRLNRSTSGSKQYSYKLNEIHNALAERNNPLLSFYHEKSQTRIKTAERNYDSSHLKKNIENYGRPLSTSKQSPAKAEKNYDDVQSQRSEITQDSRRSTRGQITYSKALRNSGENLMQTSANKRAASKQLDIIYEDPYGQNNDLDPKQKEILEKYYLQSRRNLRPSQRMMKTPLMTPDNDIKFVDNGSLIKNPKPTKTPPPPMWGEESEVDETAGEPFYDVDNDPARNSRTLLHLDSSRSRRKQFFKEKLKEHQVEEEGSETIIIQNKRPKGSKLKKKIIYVYDSDSDEGNEPTASKREKLLPYGFKQSNPNNSYMNAKGYKSQYDDLANSSRAEKHNRSSEIGPTMPYREFASR